MRHERRVRRREREMGERDERFREHRRRRRLRRGRRAYIRSVYFLPSLCTLMNAVCGFGAMYVSTLDPGYPFTDKLTRFFAQHAFSVGAYLIFAAMVFDALDGRLARFTRHTTDFGGQLDSLSDGISFGAAPAFLALQVFRHSVGDVPVTLSRLIWAIGALYMGCALMRLARFNVSNEHGEQHHFSFLGLPSPGAGGVVAAFILMEQDLRNHNGWAWGLTAAQWCVYFLPLLVLAAGLLMVSTIRYPHLVNRYMRGRRSLARLVGVVALLLLVVVAHEYTIAIGTLIYVLMPPVMTAMLRARRRAAAAAPGGRGPLPGETRPA
jgi:CDP-diacylglycerol--serine O-phosphatidyltransferase